MFSEKLSTTIKREITKDWSELFVHFLVYNPMQLLRRYGCLLQCISLDRNTSNDEYLPVHHFFNLANPLQDTIVFSAYTVLLTKRHQVEDYVSIYRHRNNIDDIVLEFKKQVPALEKGNLKGTEIIDSYNSFINKHRSNDTLYPIIQWYDILCLLVWCEESYETKIFIDKCLNDIQKWPNNAKVEYKIQIESFLYLSELDNQLDWITHQVNEKLVQLKISDKYTDNLLVSNHTDLSQ